MDDGQDDEMTDAETGDSYSNDVPIGIPQEDIDIHQQIMAAGRSPSARRKPIGWNHVQDEIRSAQSADELVGILSKYRNDHELSRGL
jgi:hypothetical protein